MQCRWSMGLVGQSGWYLIFKSIHQNSHQDGWRAWVWQRCSWESPRIRRLTAGAATKDQLNRKHLTQEADWESEVPLAENWPSTGEIKFDGCVIIPTSLLCKLTCVRYATKYRPELPCVLENFNLDVLDNEKVNRLAEEILANFHRLALLVALGLASPVWA